MIALDMEREELTALLSAAMVCLFCGFFSVSTGALLESAARSVAETLATDYDILWEFVAYHMEASREGSHAE